MTLPARFSLLHSDLNDFLFAAVGDEANGMPLNVVSALTRLGVDPWDEAARLSTLPKAVAVATLAPMIARLPICRPPRSDDWETSHRLVELLPARGQAARGQAALGQAAQPNLEREAAKERQRFRLAMVLASLVLAAAVLAAIW
jgi:hypothetical protein